MQKESKDKMIRPSESKTKSGELQEFHFSGSGEYEPTTIKAHSQEEALAEWETVRKKVEPNQSLTSNE